MVCVTRRRWLLALAGAPVALGLSAQPLSVRLESEFLHINAPGLQFLTGRPLERIQDGATVGFLGQLTLLNAPNGAVQARSVQRFLVSWDLWEKTFQVTLVTPGLATHPSQRNLSVAAAQAWCLDTLQIDSSHLDPQRPLYFHLEVRAEEPRDEPIVGPPGISIGRLIEYISRPPGGKQLNVTADLGPVTLAELRKRAGIEPASDREADGQ